MEEDVIVKVAGIRCELELVSPRAQRWGRNNFDASKRLFVDLSRCANYVRAIEAEGMRVGPGKPRKVVRARRPVDPPEEPHGIGLEMRVISVFSTVLISVVFSVRVWHVIEPLFTDIRRWWIV